MRWLLRLLIFGFGNRNAEIKRNHRREVYGFSRPGYSRDRWRKDLNYILSKFEFEFENKTIAFPTEPIGWHAYFLATIAVSHYQSGSRVVARWDFFHCAFEATFRSHTILSRRLCTYACTENLCTYTCTNRTHVHVYVHTGWDWYVASGAARIVHQ